MGKSITSPSLLEGTYYCKIVYVEVDVSTNAPVWVYHQRDDNSKGLQGGRGVYLQGLLYYWDCGKKFVGNGRLSAPVCSIPSSGLEEEEGEGW